MARRNQSLFSRILRGIAGQDVVKRNRRASAERTRTLRAEQLEARRVFAGLAFDSVIPLGDDIYASTINDLVVDSDGNRYVTGGFRGTVDFDPANTQADNSDVLTSFGDRGSIFVAKYFQDGSLAWARRMGSDTVGLVKTEWGRGIVVDEAGNSYVTGSFYSTAEFGDFSLSSAGGMDAFLVKLDPQGDVTWATSWGTTGTDSGSSLIVAEDGSIVVGSSSPQLTNLHKFESANGSQHWAKSYGGDSLSVGVKVEEDESGNLLLTNSFGSNPIDVDPGTGVYLIDHGVGAQGTYVLKLNANAEFIWARTFETLASSPYGSAYPRDIAVDLTGAVIVAGSYRNLVDFNPSPNGYHPLPNVSERSFVTKLSAAGELVWARDLEDSQVVVTDNDNNVYSFGKTLVSLAPSGIVRWEAGLRGTDGNSFTLRAAAITNDNQVVVGGHFTGTVDFDPAISEYNLTASAQTSYIQTLALDQSDVNLFPQTLFEDSFELSQWNGKWVQDSQNDWFQSTQRSTTGSNSAEVDGSANNATLTTANVIDLSGMQSATLTFDWLIESGFDSGEYLSLDISTNGGASWTQDVRRLNGNVSTEDVWRSETVDLTPYKSSQLKIRYRSTVSASDEDANVDNVRIVGIADGPNANPVANAGSGYAMNEGGSIALSAAGSNDPDGSIISYAWDFDNDGQYDDAIGVAPSYSTTNSGSRVIGLLVTDNRGATASTTTIVAVNNVAPTANARNDATASIGQSVTLSAAGSSDPGQDITSYLWDLNNDGVYGDASGMNAVFTSAVVGVFTVGLQVTDADGAVGFDSLTMTINPAPVLSTKFYVVDDASPDRTFEYAASGTAVENYGLGSGNTAPRGAASTVAGDKVWVVDANKKVYIYDASGVLLGSWTAGSLVSNATIEGITTNGTDIWLVDARQDRVYRYAGAASRLSGSQNAASSFALNSGNRSPKDLVTDGSNIWVVESNTTDRVFKYSMNGSLVGNWVIDTANASPTGITIDPSGATQSLWIVDNGSDRVYEYTNARSRNSGSQLAAASFALSAGNTNPQGIADPPVADSSQADASVDAFLAAPLLNPSGAPGIQSPAEWIANIGPMKNTSESNSIESSKPLNANVDPLTSWLRDVQFANDSFWFDVAEILPSSKRPTSNTRKLDDRQSDSESMDAVDDFFADADSLGRIAGV
jgi:hypothetical protein